MKITEIIVESSGQLKLRKDAESAIPGLQGWPDLDNGNVPYLQYRFGMALAGSPDVDTKELGPFAGLFHSIAYTEADQAILDGAAKILNFEPIQKSSRPSMETDDVQKKSTTRQVGAIQRKTK